MKTWRNFGDRPKKLKITETHGDLTTTVYETWVEPGHVVIPPMSVQKYVEQHPEAVEWDGAVSRNVTAWLEDGPCDGESYQIDVATPHVLVPRYDDDMRLLEHRYRYWQAIGNNTYLYQYAPEEQGAFVRELQRQFELAEQDMLREMRQRSNAYWGNNQQYQATYWSDNDRPKTWAGKWDGEPWVP